MNRKLTDEERELWDRLRQSVRPLAKGSVGPAEGKLQPTESAEKKPARKHAAKPAPASLPDKAAPSLARLDERNRRRLARGLIEVDARIDLHGMRQERAFSLLQRFLREAQARGHRIVLVVTGKGRAGGEDRGVLRRTVPAWLSHPDLRHLVVGYEEASRRHGGVGALYVRVRRRREGRRANPTP